MLLELGSVIAKIETDVDAVYLQLSAREGRLETRLDVPTAVELIAALTKALKGARAFKRKHPSRKK